MALAVLETYEYKENGDTYIYTKYQRKGGGITEERRIKSDPAPIRPEEPQPEPVTLKSLQYKIDQLEQQNMALMMGMVDVYSAVTTNKGE